MNREEFILKYLNEMFGHLASAYFQERVEGAELAVRLRAAFAKSQDLLGRAYADLAQPNPPRKP